MSRLKKPICIVLLFFSLQGLSQGFSPFELLTPNPVEGENIQIYYYNCEAPAPNLFTGEYYYVQQDDDVISVVISMAPGLPTCPFAFEYYYDVGGLTAGEYIIDVYVTSSGAYYPINLNGEIPVDTYTISVLSAPTTVPSTNLIALVILGLLFVVFTYLTFRQKELK